ncbi:uncharacterized protein PFL1_03827 [Pseudozyma flocculosa PF-1]|uniref:Uncharacterized protein n=1 Tax=Pseudozyma flocculosa PF-1 TaxID=1277687 RepID=A0A061H7X3_9BASI|nr:uncharacterized protein PFL1_03827 [Pseudozyma flocculosa PF-1]EPQ28524.1 hypothetical protein PFL1_03827 [Pseudozyma flocculosa PF-1]
MPPSKKPASPSKQSHAARAAALLSRARAHATSTSPTKPSSAASSSSSSPSSTSSSAAVPLPDLLKQLTSKGGLTMHDAMAVTGKLINARCNTPHALSHISLIALQDMGVESEEHRKRTVLAFKGKKAAGITGDVAAAFDPSSNSPRKRRRRDDDDDALSREYGNVSGPSDRPSARNARPAPVFDYVFNEVLEESSLRGRYAVVNRAPVMTAWATILLERLAFSRAEALSLAHCYVNYTSTMRGISLGIIPASEREKASNKVGPNQPHFELMGVKIPVMQMADGTYRGISGGEVVGPEKAFNYMRRSMAQTLSSVIGALTLLADSYIDPPPKMEAKDESEPLDAKTEHPDGTLPASTGPPPYGAEYLNTCGYDLYADFRPSTSGEWGKKGRLWYDKILALRRGHEADLAEWRVKEERLEGGGPIEEEWSEDIERLVQEELKKEDQTQTDHPVKLEAPGAKSETMDKQET